MTDTYEKLLAEVQPRVIRNEDQYQHALAKVDELMRRYNASPSEDLGAILELAATLVESYEKEHFAMPEASPREILAFLMEEHKITQEDLAAKIGKSSGHISNVLKGARPITLDFAKRCAEVFSRNPRLFLGI